MSYPVSTRCFSWIPSASEAQLHGELPQDFTSPCRAELLSLLNQRRLDDESLLLPLLVSTDEEILLLALQTLASRSRSHHLVHDERTSMMVREISRGWPPLDLLSCVSGESSDLVENMNLGTFPDLEDPSCLGQFNRLVRELHVPAESRFGLLSRIRFARAFNSSTEARHGYVKVMILAMQVQWERKLMRRQLRKLVKSGKHQIPESIRLLALETLTAYGETGVFSAADRERRAEDFLSGKKNSDSSSFLEAMLVNSSPVMIRGHHHHRELPGFIVTSACAANVLSWLEEELENGGAVEHDKVVERLLLSVELENVQRSSFEGDKSKARLRHCLLNLFRDSELFGPRVFNRAASLVFLCKPGDSAELESGLVEAMLRRRRQVNGEAGMAFFFEKMTPEVEQKAVQLLVSDLKDESESASFLLRHALHKQGRFTSSLLAGGGGYDLIRQLPLTLLVVDHHGDKLKAEGFPVSLVYQGWSRELDDELCSSGDIEKLATLLQRLQWMMRLGGDAFLRHLAAQGAVLQKKLAAAFQAVAWPLKEAFCLLILKQLVESPDKFPDISLLVDSVLGFHGARFLLELAGKWPSSESVMLATWRQAGSDQRGQALACLLNETGPAPVFTRLVSSREDVDLVPGVESKVVEMLRASSSSSARKELLLILNHILEVLDWDAESLFIPRRHKSDRSIRLESVAWYSSSLRAARGSVELLRLGVTLTRGREVAEELLSAWKLPHLVDTLLEAAGDDPCAKVLAAQTVVHLLEDDRVLYRSMVHKIQIGERSCTLDDFLGGLSSEALRDPAVFLRACSAACDFTRTPGMMHLKAMRERPKLPMLDSPRFRVLFAHLLSRLDDAALDLLTAVLHRLPVSLQAAINAGAVERVLESSCISDLAFSRFVDVFEDYSRNGAITRALLNVFSSPSPGTGKVINACKRLVRCWDFVDTFPAVFDGILRSLRLLDLDHPEAQAAAASVIRMIVRCLDRGEAQECDAAPAPAPPPLPDAWVTAFRSRLHQMPSYAVAEGQEGGLLRQRAEEQGDMMWSWRATEEQIETLGRFLWLPPGGAGKGFQALLARVLVYQAACTSSSHLVPRLLIRILHGRLHHPERGVPELVVRRALHVLWKISRLRGNHLSSTGLEIVALLITSGMKASAKLSIRVLEAVVLQLQERLPLSPHQLQLHTLCHLALVSSDRLSSNLVSLVSMDPGLSAPFLSCITALSSQVISSALEKLERGDYSSSGAVARLALMIQGLPDAGAREHLSGALAPLWRFVRVVRKSIGKPMQLMIQALFIAEALSAHSCAPSEFSVHLLRNIARNHTRLVKLALPMLRRWPQLEGVDFSTKLACLRDNIAAGSPRTATKKLCVSRDNILRDSFKELARISPEFLQSSANLTVTFAGERGVDGGGLRREWYQILSRAIGEELFTEAGNPRRTLHIPYFRFAGRLVAKAIVDDERLDLHLSSAFYKHLLGQEVSFQDIHDPQHLRNINWLLENRVDESMGFTFSVDVEEQTSYDLVEGGRDIPVTDVNKHEFIKLLGDYLLTKSFRLELDAFLDGFYEVMPKTSISMFLPAELELVICGLREINVADLKSAAKCKHDDQMLQWFWEVVAGFDNENKALLLKFITGSSKVPLGGIKQFCIARGGGEEHLPTSHTCANEIHFPSYKTKEQLKHKLLLAIQEERFEFG